MMIRSVARGFLDMSVNVQVVSTSVADSTVLFRCNAGDLFSGLVGVINVRQYHVDLKRFDVSPSNALKCTKLGPKMELIAFKPDCNTW